MPQAALATLALLLATLYSMQRQRTIFDGQMRMVTNEMEMMATSVMTRMAETSNVGIPK